MKVKAISNDKTMPDGNSGTPIVAPVITIEWLLCECRALVNLTLQFVAYFSQELFAGFNVAFGFDSLALEAVDDSDYASALLSFRD